MLKGRLRNNLSGKGSKTTVDIRRPSPIRAAKHATKDGSYTNLHLTPAI